MVAFLLRLHSKLFVPLGLCFRAGSPSHTPFARVIVAGVPTLHFSRLGSDTWVLCLLFNRHFLALVAGPVHSPLVLHFSLFRPPNSRSALHPLRRANRGPPSCFAVCA